MNHYAVGLLTVTDPAWVRDYLTEVTAMVQRHGGRYLARTGDLEALEGDAPQIVVLIEWPSKEAAQAFYESEEYRPHRDARQAGATNQFLLVAGEDVARAGVQPAP